MPKKNTTEKIKPKKLKIGALISGGGTNLQAVIDACESGKIDGEMVFVGSDAPGAPGLARGKKHSIPTFVVNYQSFIKDYKNDSKGFKLPLDFKFNEVCAKQHLFPIDGDPDKIKGKIKDKIKAFFYTRAAAEAKLLAQIAARPIDLLILAGFMRNLTPYFIDHFNDKAVVPRIMNIHPALLPSFPGVDGYGDTFRYGCKVGGCTVHFIDYGEDSGPIIGQKSFEILADDTLDIIKKKGLELEWQLFPECIQLFAEDRLKVFKITHTRDDSTIYQRSIVKIAKHAENY